MSATDEGTERRRRPKGDHGVYFDAARNRYVAQATVGYDGRGKRIVTMHEFEDAKDKVMMGAERRSTAMTQAEKELTAYHEAGHAILALNVPSADPLHKATISPRGRWWADDGKHREELARHDPYAEGLPAEIAQQQAGQYAELFKVFVEQSDIIERVSFWNLHDGQSWLNYFPWRRVNHPLLFDRDRRPKAAFDAVYDVLLSDTAER
jgi:hypothetical protein